MNTLRSERREARMESAPELGAARHATEPLVLHGMRRTTEEYVA